jgi:hypothetical protein
MPTTRTVRTKLLKWPQGVAMILPDQAARACSFRPGAFVRVIVLPNELRIRLNTVPCVDDHEPYDAFLERQASGESYMASRLQSSLLRPCGEVLSPNQEREDDGQSSFGGR